MDIDINHHKPESLDSYVNYILTLLPVCDNTKQSCPVFMGNSDSIIHQIFQDPTNEKASEDEILNEFRNIQDLIKILINSL